MENRKVWFLALVAAMGGFLFGYDTAVINGGEKEIQSVFNLSATFHGLVMSAALWGTVLGAFFGGRIADRFGRKPTLLCVGALYLLSAVWSGLAGSASALFVARFIGGLGVGCSSVVAPVYIAEISPTEKRGLMTAIFQLDVVLGICTSQFINMGIAKMGEGAWRWMLGSESFPAFLFFALCFFIVESPKWMAERGKAQASRERKKAVPFWSKTYRKPILIVICVALFNQLSGINSTLYYMPRIYGLAGFSDSTSLLLSAMANVFLAAGTFVGMILIDRIGRKGLLIIGGAGYVLSLFSLALSFHFGMGWAATVSLVVFLLSHAIGQGTVIWVIMAEVFPTSVRGQGQGLGAFTHWTTSATITLLFPIAVERSLPEVIFGVFGMFMVVHLLWAIFCVPETKGKTLEELGNSMK